jgi:hypothetical protein
VNVANATPPAFPDREAAAAIDEGTLARAGAPPPGPAGLDGALDRTAARSLLSIDHWLVGWKDLGFSAPPQAIVSHGRRLYRVWGGSSLEKGDAAKAGAFFSFARPASRRHAERLFAIVEYGNACTHVSEFDVPLGTPMLVGPVDPGDDVIPDLADAGEQVFVPNPWAQWMTRAGPAMRLHDDFGGAWVYSGEKTRDPGKAASS